MAKKKVIKNIKKEIWDLGNWDSYSMEVLQETAWANIEAQYPELSQDEIEELVPVYVDGFCGTNEPKSRRK